VRETNAQLDSEHAREQENPLSKPWCKSSLCYIS
jgi:hypothetical protein